MAFQNYWSFRRVVHLNTKNLTSVAVVNAKFPTNPWHSNWAHEILDKVAAHYWADYPILKTRTRPRIWRLPTSQMYTLLSVDPLIMYAPSGLNAACNTRNTRLCQCMCVCNYHHITRTSKKYNMHKILGKRTLPWYKRIPLRARNNCKWLLSRDMLHHTYIFWTSHFGSQRTRK